MSILSDTDLLKVKFISAKDPFFGQFIIEPLSPGYGMTIGHTLRRVLLSSLSGAAITDVKINGINHEFSTLPGVKEDMVELILNLKSIRVKLHGDDAVVIKLEKKGAGEVSAKDFTKNSSVEIINTDQHIASLDNKGKLSIEATVKKGIGYDTVENRQEKMPLGAIAIDAIFTPIKKIHYDVENIRVGRMTNYDKLSIEITTDGSIVPESAIESAVQIILDHFSLVQSQIGKKTNLVKSASKDEKIDKDDKKTKKTVDVKKAETKVEKNKKVVKKVRK